MERLTDPTTAANIKTNYEGLRAAGMPRDIGTERYIKLAEYENADEQSAVVARWEINCDGYYPYCSNCMNEPPGRELTEFCPRCGAKMTKRW